MSDIIGEMGRYIAPVIGAIAGGTSAAIAARAFVNSKRVARHQLMANLLDKYAKEDMRIAIRSLWQLWRDAGGEDEYLGDKEKNSEALVAIRKAMIAMYVAAFEKSEPIDTQRRLVSNFYQLAAVIVNRDKSFAKMFYILWSRRDLEIIVEILAPIEMEGIQAKLGGQPILEQAAYHPYMKEMIKLYRNARRVTKKAILPGLRDDNSPN